MSQESAYKYTVDDPSKPVSFKEKWSPKALYNIILYFMICFMALTALPNNFWDPQYKEITIIIGVLGTWRYCWWLTHAIRARIYQFLVYPKLRAKADAIFEEGWKASHVHFMMTTFKEHRQVTEMVMQSIIDQVIDLGSPGTIWLGSGDIFDERIISNYLRQNAKNIDLNLVIIRQNQPGKRLAIGLVLRAMNRGRIGNDDIVVFMDGDAIIGPGCVRKCATLFLVDPELQAVTTDEEVVCYGPAWVRTWLLMRFAQRRIAMQSHALSKKVLTLTGRMSVFRAKHLANLKMIRLLEADHLEHWLWGEFRFLSGDDKSTWYYMLLQNAKMLYVPDAMVYTVEFIEGTGLDRMVQNFRRWSGNMLRNGSRALALGPHKVGFFIWWCILDQRIAMWTMLVSPILAIMTAILLSANYLISYAIWIAVSRMALSLVLFSYMRRIHIAVPGILYFNQFINAAVKVYCLFRLSKQRWSNRGDQKSNDGDGWLETFRTTMASYLTALYMGMLCLGITLYSGLIPFPSINMLELLLF
ncbi:MAG: glycosyltransferase [Halopseudomonas aestusnigri]